MSSASRSLGEECFDRQDFPDIFDSGKFLGIGSYGVVRKCFSSKTKTHYAVKALSREARGLEEANICEILCKGRVHENIVRFFRIFALDTRCYLVFEYVPGTDLHTYINKNPLTLEDVRCILQQILRGIKYCHSCEIAHRDLKPGNILVNKSRSNDNPLIKILDFGLSCRVPKQDWYGFVGTPIIVAPEMIQYKPYGKPIDMWGCGVIFYNLLEGGAHPFKYNGTVATLYKRVVNKEPYDLDEILEDEYPSAKRLLHAMLDKDQKTRIKAMDALEHPFMKENFAQHVVELQVGNTKASNKITCVEDKLMYRALIAEFDAKIDLEKEAKRKPDPPRVLIIGSPVEKGDSSEVVDTKELIVRLTKLMLRSVVDYDIQIYYQLRASPTDQQPGLKCCLFGKFEPWEMGSEFNLFHLDKTDYRPDVVFSEITMMNPRVQLLGICGACITYNKIIRHSTQAGGTVVQRQQETRVWEYYPDIPSWQAIYLDVSNNDEAGVGPHNYIQI